MSELQELSEFLESLGGVKEVIKGNYSIIYKIDNGYNLTVTVNPKLELWDYRFIAVDGSVTYGATDDIEVLRKLTNYEVKRS